MKTPDLPVEYIDMLGKSAEREQVSPIEFLTRLIENDRTRLGFEGPRNKFVNSRYRSLGFRTVQKYYIMLIERDRQSSKNLSLRRT